MKRIRRLNFGSRLLLLIYLGIIAVYGVFSWQFAIYRQNSETLLFMKFLLIPVGFLFSLSVASFVIENIRSLWAILILALYFLFDFFVKSTSIYQTACMIWCFSFVVGFVLSKYSFKADRPYSFNLFVFVLLPVAMFYILSHRGEFSYVDMVIDDYWIDNNLVMIVFSLFPFVLVKGNKKFSDIAVVLVVLCAIVAVKRTTIIVAAIISVIYLFYRMNSNNFLYKLIVFIVAIIGVFFIIKYVDANLNDGEIFARLQAAYEEDDTSGRENQYVVYYGIIRQSSPLELFFGVEDITNGLTGNVHNDLLYVAYHYGLVGLLLLLTVMIPIIITVVRIVRTECLGQAMSLSCLVATTTIVICGMFNCFINTDGYTYLMLFFGYAMGQYKDVKNNSLIQLAK